MDKETILTLIRNDTWMMNILKAAQGLKLSDWMIGAGFVRNRVWDVLHGYSRPTPSGNIDLIYFDPSTLHPETDEAYEEKLRREIPETAWSIKNQARMHLKNNDPPYASSEDALAHWVETATCVAVTISDTNRLKLIAPFGINDLVDMVIRPNPKYSHLEDYRQRLKTKRWKTRWPKVKILVE